MTGWKLNATHCYQLRVFKNVIQSEVGLELQKKKVKIALETFLFQLIQLMQSDY